MSTSIQPREGVFPGYTLTDRLGSGGYAEVWRARAPGGIEKAVKIVFGCCDDQLASQEMKAMERIKDVRHPFVLSLERFEIVDGRLAILTELADMSLEQYAQACRAKGLPGIPRDKLLGFMADTADALDFLAERHNLQHLDIKPANLLISGDHIKVADFGLVKELASRTQNSMVAGMTPTYSSPEMFDDAPSSQSDQYSLAIVYQEMLTGILPFPGRTAAQLANQHLRSQPQLTALPECDRAVVARALAKDPTERFYSCRAFVKALSEVNSAAGIQSAPVNRAKEVAEVLPQGRSGMPSSTMPRMVGAPRPTVGTSKAPQPTEAKSHSSIDTTAIEKPASAPVAQPKEDIVDVNVPEVSAETMQLPPPTLYIGIGGVGIKILSRLRDLFAHQADAGQPSTAVEMLAIDTDREELRSAASLNWRFPLTATDTVHVPLKMPQVYREEGRSNLEWLSHRWLYNIPRSLETRGYRPLGRLALVDHVDKVVSLVDQKLRRLEASEAGDANLKKSQEIQVVLLTSMGGGTGSGMAIDLANAVRSRVQASGHPALVRGVFVCTCLENANAPPLSAANTYALLTELQFASQFGNQSAQTESQNLKQLESLDRPFEQIYCVKLRQHGKESTDDELAVIARQLSLASADGVSQTLQHCREAFSGNQPDAQQPLLWRTFGSALVDGPMQTRVDRLSKYLARELVRQWLEEVPAEVWERFDQPAEKEGQQENEGLEDETAAASDLAAAKSEQVEKLRRAFGGNCSTRFAYEVVVRVVEQDLLVSEGGPALLSPQHPQHFGAITAQALSSIKEIVAEHLDELSAEDETIVRGLAADGGRVLARYLEEIDQMSADSSFETAAMLEVLPTLCTKVVEEYYAATTASIESSAMRMSDAQASLKSADVDLLQCGYQRHTLIAVPCGRESGEAIDVLKAARPTAATITAKVDEAFILCEGSGIKPTSLARGFERVYPGIASAASRLFTRIDVNWSDSTL